MMKNELGIEVEEIPLHNVKHLNVASLFLDLLEIINDRGMDIRLERIEEYEHGTLQHTSHRLVTGDGRSSEE